VTSGLAAIARPGSRSLGELRPAVLPPEAPTPTGHRSQTQWNRRPWRRHPGHGFQQQQHLTERFTNAVGRLDPSTSVVTEFPLAPDAGPEGIAAAPDGSLWSTQFNAGNIARITTAGLIAEARRIRGSEPFGITVAPDGNPWYAELSANKIPSCN